MSKQKKAEAAILSMLDDIDIDTSLTEKPLHSINKQGLETKINLESPNKKKEVIFIKPSLCEPWKYADRDESEMGDIEALANSIKTNGQQEPALVRKVNPSDGQHVQYEVIFGHRRWLACMLCDTPLMAMLSDMDDKQAAIAQKEENENRQNLSDYARALNYKKLLDDDVFKNIRELAANLNISKSKLGRILSYTKIPTKLIDALTEPHLLSVTTAEAIAKLCSSNDENIIDILCKNAMKLINGSIHAGNINKLFENKESESHSSCENVKKIYKNSFSVNLFTSNFNQNKTPCFTFNKVVIDNGLLPELEELVHKFLKEKTEKNPEYS